MALDGSRWSGTLFAALQAKGFMGSRLQDFTDAVGKGSVTHVVGKSFTTLDVGTVPGNGVGTGVGIIGFAPSQISSLIFSFCQGAGFTGSRLRDVCDAVGQAASVEMALASLSSIDAPVFLGVGNIVPGSIGVDGGGWGSSIQSVGSGENFIGSKWPDFAQALGKGQALPVQSTGTGILAITGSPSGVPVPGTGNGSGTIS